MNIKTGPASRMVACLSIIAAPFLAVAETADNASAQADSAAYTFGVNMGQQLRQNGVGEPPMTRLIEGLKDGLAGKRASAEDQEQLQVFLRAAAEAAVARNAAGAKAFLEANATRPGVVATASGLQYRIIAAGDPRAASPRPTDRVTVRYRGTLIDGTEFDNSAKHAAAAPIAVNNAIKGWQEALALMKPKAKWQLFVPPDLGYGNAARPGIPGGSLLIFDLELTSLQPAPAPPPKVP